jgi:hypothetical protein
VRLNRYNAPINVNEIVDEIEGQVARAAQA